MSTGLAVLQVHLRRLSPAQVEVWLQLPEAIIRPGMELRGRYVGPRCAGISTIEVAYPLLPLAGPREAMPGLVRRVVIPNPGLWDPQRPFLYEGVLELVEDGQVTDRIRVMQGFRAVRINAGKLIWNGSALTLRGVQRMSLTREDLQAIRQQDFNLALVSEVQEEELAACDRLGLLVLVRCDHPTNLGHVSALSTHPSLFGYLLTPAFLESVSSEELRRLAGNQPGSALGIGLELETASANVPAEISFVVCPGTVATTLPQSLPRIVKAPATLPNDSGMGTIQ